MILDNLAELHQRGGDLDGAELWQTRLESSEVESEWLSRVSPWRWVALCRARFDLPGALHHAERGLAQAKRFLDPMAEDRFSAELADLRFRRGEAAAAVAAFGRCLAIRRRIGEPEDVFATLVAAALASARAGALDEAEAGFREALGSPVCRGGARAEVLAALAWLAARRGDGPAADEGVNAAIGEAVASGERDVLVRVAVWAAEACLELGRLDGARDAFERALDLGRAEEEDAGPPAPETLRALLGLVRSGIDDPGLVLEALSILPAALEDSDAWWDLPHLAGALEALGDPGTVAESAGLTEAWELAGRVRSQRV